MKKRLLILATALLSLLAPSLFGQSATATLSITVNPAQGISVPLVQSVTNPLFFVSQGTTSPAIYLGGSQTWNSFQDLGNNGGNTALNFTNFVSFLTAHGHNATILWKKDLPQYCAWGAGGVWTIPDAEMPFVRSSTAGSSDGHNKFDLSTFNQAYFDRMKSRAQQLGAANIYAIVQLFDGLQLDGSRCGTTSPTGDGYPYTGVNNINSIDDGYSSGTTGDASMTAAGIPNSTTAFQVAYMKKMVDTMVGVPNVIWEISEEAPDSSTAWHSYMISQLQAYEATKPYVHPILFPTLNVSGSSDSTLYNSNATMVAPKAEFPAVGGNCGSGTPGCKVVYNDSDHSYFNLPNESTQANRAFVWENFTNGNNIAIMDPYFIFWSASNRNLCDGDTQPQFGVCSSTPDPRYNNLRDNIGQIVSYANKSLQLINMTPQPSLASTGFCIANNTTLGGSQFLVYSPNGGSFTVNLSNQTSRTINVEWYNPVAETITDVAPITGGSSAQSFTPPWNGTAPTQDAVLFLTDPGTSFTFYTPTGAGWHDLGSGTAMQPNGPGGAGDVCPSATSSSCANISAWSSAIVDQANRRMLIGPGGGHTDYSGNEIYSIDLGPTNAIHRATAQSTTTSGVEAASSPTAPNARHSYGGLVYIEHKNLLTVTGGCLFGTNCPVSHGQWTLDLTTVTPSCYATSPSTQGCAGTWTEIDGTQSGTSLATIFSTDQPVCDYWNEKLGNQANNTEYCFFPNAGAPNFLQINYDTNTNTLVGSGLGGQDNHLGGAIDQAKGIFIFAGNGSFGGFNLSNGAGATAGSSTGCSSLLAAAYPALWYDEVQKVVKGYPGSGINVYIINDTGGVGGAWTCTTETFGSNTPPTGTTSNGEGIFHRATYVRLEDAVLYCPINLTVSSNPANQDCWTYRSPTGRTNGLPPGERTLAFRSSSTAVTRAVNFVPNDLIPQTSNPNLPYTIGFDGFGNLTEGGVTLQTQDTSTVPATAGGGTGASLNMFAQPSANENVAGDYQVCLDYFNGDQFCQKTYGPTGTQGNTIYLQVRVMYDSNYLSRAAVEEPDSNGGEGPKVFGIHGNNPDSTCSSVGEIMQFVFFRGFTSTSNGFAQGFQNCGSGANFEWSTDPNAQASTRLLENGSSAESTGYSVQVNSSTANAAMSAANVWDTWYCKWFIPSFSSSSVVWPNGPGSFECWLAHGENQLMRKVWSFIGWSYQFQNSSSDNFSRASLTIYDSRLCSVNNYVQGTCSTYPSGHVHFSEMIISSKPIPAPYGNYNGNPYPGN